MTLSDRLTEMLNKFDEKIGDHLDPDTVDHRDVCELKDLLNDINKTTIHDDRIAINNIDTFLEVCHDLCNDVASQYFDDSSTYSLEIANEFKDELRATIHQPPTKGMVVESLSNVAAIRKLIRGLPDDGMVHLQTVAEDGTCWNMGATGKVLNDRTICISLSHPELLTLPKDDDLNNPNFYDNKSIDDIIHLLEKLKRN